jgi:hypothetical protein
MGMSNGRRNWHAPADTVEIGWISLADVSLLCVVVLISAGAYLELERHRKDALLIDRETELTKLRNEVMGSERDDHDRVELERRAASLAEELKRRAAALDRAERLLKDLDRQLGTLRSELEGKSDLLSKAEARQREATAEVLRLATALAAAEASLIAQAEQVKRLESYAAEADRLRARLAAAEEERASLVLAQNRERDQLHDARTRIEQLVRERDAARERILKPLETSDLVVRLRCHSLPQGLDLDLYVQDPNDELCYWKQPRILTKDAETGMLIPSEDMRELDGSAEEIFHSIRVKPTGPRTPYLIFCMLRENGRAKAEKQIAVEVEWQIQLRRSGKLIEVDRGRQIIRTAGQVLVQEGRYIYPNLIALHGFSLSGQPQELSFARLDAVPDLPRGWQRTAARDDAQRFEKIRDAGP